MAENSASLGVRPRRGRAAPARERKTDLVSWLQLGEALETGAPRGEIILVLARWVLIVVGMALTLNAPHDLADLQVTIVGILALAVVNFWLHTNLVMQRPSSRSVLYWTSAADIAVVTAVVSITGGVDSYVFVFYFPAILAFSLVFPFRVTAYLTAGIALAYTGTVLLSSQTAMDADIEGFAATLFTRLLTFAGVMAVANMYRWVEYQRLENEVAARPASARTSRRSTGSGPRRQVQAQGEV